MYSKYLESKIRQDTGITLDGDVLLELIQSRLQEIESFSEFFRFIVIETTEYRIWCYCHCVNNEIYIKKLSFTDKPNQVYYEVLV